MKEARHDCQKFREDWASCPSETAELHCDDCRQYCADASAIVQLAENAMRPAAEPSPEYWEAFEARLQERLRQTHPGSPRWGWAGLAAAAALAAALTWGGLRWAPPVGNQSSEPAPEHIEFADDHIQGLNPEVVEFLGQSELFLRSFTKIQPSYVEEIDDARARARRNLAEIGEQRRAAVDFAPVRIALEEYEGVLREIKNLESSGDLADIQSRIDRNGLIANLKAYQPRVVLVGQR